MNSIIIELKDKWKMLPLQEAPNGDGLTLKEYVERLKAICPNLKGEFPDDIPIFTLPSGLPK